MMPIAAAKLEKQPSTEAVEPIKQAIVVLEHKIRNLEKRKRKIEIYREDQKKGQTLNNDQLFAVSKYEVVTNTLDFAQDLCKQFNAIAVETVKVAKKQGRKEAVERSLQDAAKFREVLVVQDILQHMGHEGVREDFLAGRNNAVKLNEQDLKFLDDLYVAVSPKRETDEESVQPFQEHVSQAADHLLGIVEGKQKEVVGTTHEYLKQLITKIQDSGYFDKFVSHPEVAVEESVQAVVQLEESVKADAELTVTEQAAISTANEKDNPLFVREQPQVTPGIVPATVMLADTYLSQPTVNELMKTVAGSFNFLQESELDIPCADLPVSAIPSQTYTNQNFSPVMASVAPQSQPSQVNYGGVQVGELTPTIPGFTTPNPPPPIPMPPSHHASPYTAAPTQAAAAAVPAKPADVWPLTTAVKEPDVAANEWRPANTPTQANDWSAEPAGEWMPGDDGGGFITPNSARQYSQARNNRANNRPGGRNAGGRPISSNTNFHNGAPARNSAGFQRTNEANNASNSNYNQNGYQQQQHYSGGGGNAGFGGQFRPRSNQRGSGNRNAPPARGGGGVGNDMAGNQGRAGRTGPGSYGGRPQNNRQ